MTFGVGRNATLGVKKIKKLTSIFPMIGKKNKQLTVFDADREVQNLESTDNARHLFLALSVYPRVRISRSASETDDNSCLFRKWPEAIP